MNQVKRQRTFKKKNSLENLSNELFYEIFDYLDGYDIYKAFSNLNMHFQNLLIDSSFLMKTEISSPTIFDSNYENFLQLNKSRILSFHLNTEIPSDYYHTLNIINSLHTRLESLVLYEVSICELTMHLIYFKSLPRLKSLSVSLHNDYGTLDYIYQTMFLLSLKYFKLIITSNKQIGIPMFISTGYELSSIEYLSISHFCTLNELTDILSNTPKLSYLYCYKIYDDSNSETSIALPNLVHLTIGLYGTHFDQFEQFLSRLCSPLHTLNIAIFYSDRNYLDSDRWEKLIKSNLPHLNTFRFCFTDCIDDDFEIDPYHLLINRFTSSFWTERNWIFKLLIENDELTYIIQPFEEIWRDFEETIENNSLPVVQMTVTDTLLTKKDEPLLDQIYPILEMIQITCLDIYCEKISINIIIQLLNCLTNLKSIGVSDYPFFQKINIRKRERNLFNQFLLNNKIKKFTIRNLTFTVEINDIIDLFPRMEYLTLRYISDFDLESVVESTLLKIQMKNISHPMTFCVFCVEAEYDKLQKLKQMIDKKHLLKDYTINRRLNRFYIEWK